MSISQVCHNNPEFQALSKIRSYYPSLLETLLTLMEFNKRKDFCPARSMINEELSEKTVGHHTDRLHADGLIIKTRDEKNKYKTCRYEVPPEVLRLEGRIRYILRAMKFTFFSISLLIPTAIPDFPPNGKNSGLGYKSFSHPEIDRHSTIRESGFFKNPSCYCERQTACAGACACDGLPPDFSIRKEAEQAMEIPKHIEDLTVKLSLTTHGKMKLSPFSESTVKQAVENLKHATGSKDLVRTLVEDCVMICKANDEKISWSDYFRAIDMGLFRKEDPLSTVKITHASLFQGRSIRQQPAPVDPQKLQAIEDRRTSVWQKEIDRLREVQRKWEASKTPTQIKEALKQEIPAMVNRMENGNVPQRVINQVVSHVATPEPIHVNEESITAQELAWIDSRFEIVQKLLKRGNLNDIEQCVVDNFQSQVEEAKVKFKIVDRWKIDQSPTWSPEDQELMDWAVPFIQKVDKPFTKTYYDGLLAEIELGPTSPRAQTRELQDGLILMRQLLDKPMAILEKTVKESIPTIQLLDVDEMDDAAATRITGIPI